jgi:BirA family biotin operon repressor/biotin-[acetyl-CoA-carboxylase] ligase
MIARRPDDPRWQHLPICGSTNDEAARLGRAGAPHGTVVTAGAQRRGRGRLGHAWHSPPDGNLYLSVLLRPPLPPARAPLLSLCAGVAVAEAVAAEVGAAGEVEIKWPNDLLLSTPFAPRRKVAGILTEMTTANTWLEFVVVGIGVNLNSTAFPPDLAGRATSLRLCTGREVPPLPFAGRLLGLLDEEYQAYVASGSGRLIDRFSRHAAFLRRGDPIVVRTAAGSFTGRALSLQPDGALLVRDTAGAVHRVIAGEIVLAERPSEAPCGSAHL